MRIYGSQRQITHLDASMVRLIKTLQELDKRGLATAALSHNRRHLTFWYFQADVIEGIISLSTIIAEGNVLYTDGPVLRQFGNLVIKVSILIGL